ncbi:HAD family hydrolase [Mycobacterium sp. ITM-2016-00317]|uniref:HAD family hydrolase n=1 Tax=Mycobacterium sp. ITM-2016-00317 TaxID=2099694 RepID=UPI00287FB07C|nr:HAD family hydrolase [Mycobacterium sp. ITM-2016-00317]WNG87015.1 HAD family hydrolase [Mycobacterium sp. ITM-2016-00317]
MVVERMDRQWCLFVDRDGVINRRIVDGYVREWGDFEWLPGAKRALGILRAWAPQLVVVTNQQGVGKGLMASADVAMIHDQMRSELAESGVSIDGFQVCPHLAASECRCRKPRPGLILDWLHAHSGSQPALSVMCGDSRSDLELADNVAAVTGGCAGIQIGEPTGVSAYASYDTLWDFAAAVEHAIQEQVS